MLWKHLPVLTSWLSLFPSCPCLCQFPAVNTNVEGSLSCCLLAVQRADVAGSQPGSLLPTELVVEPAVLWFLFHPGSLSFVSGGTVPPPTSLCFETLDPSFHLMEKCAHEGFLHRPATREVESNLFHSDPLLRQDLPPSRQKLGWLFFGTVCEERTC